MKLFLCSPPCPKRKVLIKTLLIMKFTAVFLLIACLHVNANSYSQQVTLSVKNAKLRQVLNQIKKQTGVSIFWDEEVLKKASPVSFNIKAASLDEAISSCLKGQPLTYSIGQNLVVIKAMSANDLRQAVEAAPTPSPVKITGKVLSNENIPLVGASVNIKGTNIGTTTDANGKFSLNTPGSNGILVISYVGFVTREISFSKASDLQITLIPTEKKIDEVIVVGYGTQKKINLTGAVTQVSGEVLQDRPMTRITQGLQGMVAGLNVTTTTDGGAPNGTQSFNVRGYTGLGATGSPLVVIDGVQGGDINAINPADVESISVLKDAASTAIYGSSAPYGVILITTKQGAKGKRPRITYNNNFSFTQTINLPKMLNSLDFANIYNEAFENAGRADFFDSATIARIKDYQAGRITTQTIKSPSSNSWQGWNGANANNDWFKIYFKKFATSQQHTVGISGGSDNTTYYVGLGYNDKEGMYNYGNDYFKRFNIRANLSTNVTQWMTFNMRTTFSRSLYNTPNTYPGQTGGNYMHQIARKFPTVPLYNPDGQYSDGSNIPLQLYGGRTKSTEDQPVLTGEFVIRPLKDWTITANYTFDGDFYDYSSQVKTVYNYLPDGTTSMTSGTSPNSFSRNNYRNEHQIFNAYSSYKKVIGQHNFSILGGFTSELTSYTSYSVSNTQLYSNDIPSLNLTYGTSPSIGDQMRQLAVEGYFGRLNYSFADKYLLELDGRYDATSRFLPGKRWKFSPGVSAGWNIDKENFWSSIRNTINAFKLRGSYGSSPDQLFLGNPSVASWYPFYPSLGIASPTNTSWLFGGAQQAAISQPPLVNSDLTWVTTTSYGIGADIYLLKNRLSLSYDYYIRKADNFAGPSQVLPSLLGTGVPSVNNAGIKTTGFEVTAQWKDRVGALGYSARVSLSDYQGKVTQYNNPTRSLSTWYMGQKMGEIWGYQTNGLYQANDDMSKAPKTVFWGSTWNPGDVKYRDLNGDGLINGGLNTADSSGDRRIIGNSTPRYQFSTLFNFDYKGFDLSIFLQGILKRDAWIGSNYFWGITGDEWQSSPFQANMNRWTTNNPNGYFPKYYMSSQNSKNTQVSDRYLQNAAYVRLKSIQLGYTLPAKLVSKAMIQKLRVYFTAENVATFTKLVKNLDPELSISDGKIYPMQRTFSFGLNIIL